MTNTEHFDLIVIGNGQGGDPLAKAFASAGRKTAVVERSQPGGTCVNWGCTPTKTMVASAEAADWARNGAKYGVLCGDVTVDMKAVLRRKEAVVAQSREGTRTHLKSTEHLDYIEGSASFIAEKTLSVILNAGGERIITAPIVVIDTGGRSTIPKLDGLAAVSFLTSTSIMELDTVPEHLIVLGGGYIGLEFAQMFKRFGSNVTIVQRSGQLLGREDEDIAQAVSDILRGDGIEILLNAEAISVSGSGENISLMVNVAGAKKEINGSHLLVAVGRTPNVEDLKLDIPGIRTDDHGFIKVNDRLETNVPGIYVIGDVKGGPAFTHISYDDYRVLKANLLTGGATTTIAGRQVPYVVFIDPQLGRIGVTESEAKKLGIPHKVATLPMSSVSRANELGKTQGLIKAIVSTETDQILGAAVLGVTGGELLAVFQTAMLGKLLYTVLRDGIWTHPTVAESLNNLFADF